MPVTVAQLQDALRGRYVIERELGQGGMATVYLATDPKHHRSVAIKVLRPEIASTMGTERFLREIEVVARLAHPHILPLYDSGQAGEHLFYVMPLVEGGTLRERLGQTKQLPLEEAVEIVRAIAHALAYAHDHDVIHRDIKPENILLQSGVPVVADFGIGRAISGANTLTEIGMTVGTPAYMSPEQSVGDSLDGRSDLYSLGCVLYEMLGGEQPFRGPTVQSVIEKRLTEPAPHITAIRGAVPAAVDQVLCKALARAPADRFAAMADFTRALEEALSASAPPPGSSAGEGEAAVAVLPFRNMSADAENEFISDGMTEEIINALTNVKGLRVIARTSAFAFKNTDRDVREVGRTLNVGSVLEGSVRKSGKRLRINVQLVEVATGLQLWSDRYDRELDDVFALQDEIATMVAARLQTALAPQHDARPRPTENAEAHEAFLRGRFYWNTGTLEGYQKSVEWYERAIALDPKYAHAHMGLGEALCQLAFVTEGGDLFGQAKEMALQAIALDDSLADAHAILGHILNRFDWDWARAEEEFTRAIALNPHSSKGHGYYCAYLANLGRVEEAVVEGRRAIELDPLWVVGHATLQYALFQAGEYGPSIEQGRKALELVPNHGSANYVMGYALHETGAFEQAVAAFQLSVASSGATVALAGLARSFLRLGRAAEARQCLADLMARRAAGTAPAAAIAWVHIALGEADQAFAWLDRAVRQRDPFLQSLPRFCWWDPLRGDPRFDQLMRRLNFPAWCYGRGPSPT